VTVGGALCVCGDTQEEHRRGTGGCREPECGCGRFEPTGSYAATPAGPVLDVAALLAEAQGDADREAELAARLVEVERERNDALRRASDLEQVREELAGALRLAEVHREGEQALAAELDEVVTDRIALRAEVDRLEALLEHAEQHSRDLQDDGVVLGDVLGAYDAWQCVGGPPHCGRRFYVDDPSCGHGPLTPVTVTISRRSA
jgi:hypothetical protein